MVPNYEGATMSTIFMSSKGGNCTTVTAAAVALLSASRQVNTVLIDLCGDLPATLGLAEPSTPGINDWLSETRNADAQTLMMLGTSVSDGLTLVHRGSQFVEGQPRWSDLAKVITSTSAHIIIDAGTGFLPPELICAVDEVTLVTKPCYLSLRRATTLPRPTNVFVVNEPGRALNSNDVAHVLGVPIGAEIPYDSSISRAVDAGLLAHRVVQLFGQHIPPK